MAAHLVLLVVVVGDLVALAELQRETSCDAAAVSVVDARPAGVRDVRRETARHLHVLVEEAVGHRLVHAEIAERGVEPQLVFEDRPAEARRRVVVLGQHGDVLGLGVGGIRFDPSGAERREIAGGRLGVRGKRQRHDRARGQAACQ